MEYVDTPGIVKNRLEDRRYQAEAARYCLREDSLLILPTALGKTSVALRVAAHCLTRGKKVLMMAPTKPLVDQHSDFFSSFLDGYSVSLLNGDMPPAKRTAVVAEGDFIISTPQCIANDLETGRYDLSQFGLVIYDEAHKAVGGYAYVDVARHVDRDTASLGMTASPGSDIKKVEEICDNLNLTGIFVRTEEDPDVSPYVHDTYVNRIVVNMPEDLLKISSLYRRMLDSYFSELRAMGLVTNPNWPASTKHLLSIGQMLQMRLGRGEKTSVIFRGLKVQSICIKLLRAIDYTETQGMSVLRSYLTRIEEDAESGTSKADKELVANKDYKEARDITETSRVEHPKVSRIMGLVSRVLSESEGSKIIVFTQYRETCEVIADKLSRVDGARVCKLIGQSNGGQKQKEQIGTLDDFRTGKYNVVVSTSVGEEGLDITSTNAVIFYEPVPSEIRTIQRRGRTGRKNDGEVYVLVAGGTLDEITEQASKRKEMQMRDGLDTLRQRLEKKRGLPRGQRNISDF